MQQNMQSHAYLPQRVGDDRRTLFMTFGFSFICHLVFFVILIFVPGFAKGKKSSLSIINVSIVTLPALEKALLPDEPRPTEPERQAAVQEKDPVAKIPPKPIAKTDAKTSKAVSIKPTKKKVKQSLKKKTFKSSKVVKSAITKIEKKVQESRPDEIKKAIARLKDQVAKTEVIDHKKDKDQKGLGIPGGSGAASKRDLELIDLYRIEIAYIIQKNWAFSEQLAGGRQDLEAWVAIKVMSNGEIKDVWFDKRSGNSYFDEAAEKAIKKSNPLPPFPKGYLRSFCEAGFHFTPSGIK